jgi:hypothetical protein
LLWYSHKTGNPISNKKTKTLESITSELYTRGLIDELTYDKMNKFRQLRNDYQHDGLAFKLSSQAQDAETKNTNDFRLCRDINNKLSKRNLDKSKK